MGIYEIRTGSGFISRERTSTRDPEPFPTHCLGCLGETESPDN